MTDVIYARSWPIAPFGVFVVSTETTLGVLVSQRNFDRRPPALPSQPSDVFGMWQPSQCAVALSWGISPRNPCFSAIASATCAPIDSANRVSSEPFHHACAGSITLLCKTPPMLMGADAPPTARSAAGAQARDVR